MSTELEAYLDDEGVVRGAMAKAAETRLVAEGQRLLTEVAAHMDGYSLEVLNIIWERDHIIDEARRLAGGHDLKQMAALLHETGGYLSGTDGNHDLLVEQHEFWTEVKELCQWDHHADRYWISGELAWFEYLTGGEKPS